MQEAHPRITVDVKHEADTDVVEVKGEIDLATAPHLDEVLSGLSAPQLVIDLQGVDFIDSTGLHSLIKARARHDGGRRIRLVVRRPSPVIRLLELADVTNGFIVDEANSG
jgi:anti-anti-sigma factor